MVFAFPHSLDPLRPFERRVSKTAMQKFLPISCSLKASDLGSVADVTALRSRFLQANSNSVVDI